MHNQSVINNKVFPAKIPPAGGISSGARRVAYNVLDKVLTQDAYASLALDDYLGAVSLSQADKRLCTSLVYKTLENLYRIDFALGTFLTDPVSLEPRVRNILRLSACQILFYDRIPESAAVDEAVKLTRAIDLEPLTGLVNAVLRNLSRGKSAIAWPTPDQGTKYLSVMFSVPEWLAQQLCVAYGEKTALDIVSFRAEKHWTTIRPNRLRLDDAGMRALLARKVWETEDGAFRSYRVFSAAEIARDNDFLSGMFSIQGESSMMAAEALQVKRGMQVLDCCAAPGGKTAYIAETLQGTGRVYAWDLHEHRVELIRAAMRRLKIDNVRPAVRDALVFREDIRGMMNAVLLDAPCTGIGVMDDKPDVKYRHTPETVSSLCQVQKRLLDTCCGYVAPGGIYMYSTCSLLPAENEEQVRLFLGSHSDFSIEPLPDSIPARFRAYQSDFGLQLLPHRDGVEGFFIACMRKGKR
jgi:16S rRNA (cytosine967-C5)-methyltransferase